MSMKHRQIKGWGVSGRDATKIGLQAMCSEAEFGSSGAARKAAEAQIPNIPGGGKVVRFIGIGYVEES